MRTLLLTSFILLSFTVQSQQKLTASDVRKLYRHMQGFYSSRLQSLNDSAYFDIRLKMVPMWQDREGYWLYVEQAMATSVEKPYRQRVYHLSLLNDSTIESKVYTIKNGDRYFGAWKNFRPLHELAIDSLELRNGCSIFLHRTRDGRYTGSTHAADCESNLRGATYATSEVVIDGEGLRSWDRGFDADHKQVWGAVKGAYEFIKNDNEEQ